MSKRLSKKTLILILMLVGITLFGESSDGDRSISYWLWAGITPEDAPFNSELYVFQGNIFTENDITSYERLGLYPHPIKSSKLLLVFRLENELPSAKAVIDIFQSSVKQWQRHPVSVSGIQLDFDSPTSKLLEYSHFLEEIRSRLPKNYTLSVTGLGDWAIGGDREAMRAISAFADDIVFQLYQGRQPLWDIEKYLEVLSRYPWSFRIGLLSGIDAPASVNMLDSNPNYKGIIYFIQRKI